jgi:glutamate---cysteine ligase / carboxylate-amine ligase
MTRTIGVEEELMLYDHATQALRGVGDTMTDATRQGGSADGELPSVEHEFKHEQIETATSPQQRISALLQDIEQGRRTVVVRAREQGLAPAALGTNPGSDPPTTTEDSRYQQMLQVFGEIGAGQLACGTHVHVSIESRAEGVAVIDRIRSWLPVLLAMSANSPYALGRDTGYASYRAMSWNLWPTAGPTELFGSVDAYDAEVAAQIAAGAALDEGMIYFDARLSQQYPTVEIRVMDVTPTAPDAALLATLCRAVVETAAREWQGGVGPAGTSRGIIRAATWRAARFGLTDDLVHPASNRRAPATAVVEALVDHVAEALRDDGDLHAVQEGVGRLFAAGTGAERQRAAFATTTDVRDVIAAGCEWTVP